MKISAARYGEIRQCAAEALLCFGACALPVDPFALASNRKDIRALSYRRFAQRYYGGDIRAVIQDYGNIDGVSLRGDRGYLLLYNTDAPGQPNQGRLRWTVAHELGHILLGHLCISGALSDRLYALAEREADHFAAMLLAYPCVLRACGIHTQRELVRCCALSRQAASIRLGAPVDRLAPFDDRVLARFAPYITSRYCPACDVRVEGELRFCPQCAGELLRFDAHRHGDLFTPLVRPVQAGGACGGCGAVLLGYGQGARFCHRCGRQSGAGAGRGGDAGKAAVEAIDEALAQML